jgi:hypothetical protein
MVPSPRVKSPFRPVRMRLSAAKYQRHELENPDAWFKELCTEEEARRCMLTSLKMGRDVYVLTGILTMQDGVVDVVSSSMPGLISRALMRERTPTYEKERYHSYGEVSYRTVGEAIFAISYQRVKVSTIETEISGVTAGWARKEDVMTSNIWKSVEERFIDDRQREHAVAQNAADTSSTAPPQTDLAPRATAEAPSIHSLEQPTFPHLQSPPDHSLRDIAPPSSTLLPHIDTTSVFGLGTWRTEEGLPMHSLEQPTLSQSQESGAGLFLSPEITAASSTLLPHVDLSTGQTQDVMSNQLLEGPAQSSKGSTRSMKEKPVAVPETFPARTEEANNAWLTERAFDSSAGATGIVASEYAGVSRRLPETPAIKNFLMIGEHIRRLGEALRSIFTHSSQEYEVGHPTRWQAQKAPSRRELADSFIILYWIVVTGSVCLAVFVDLIFRIAYSTFASSGHQTTSPPLYGSATNASYGHRLILSVLYDSATTAILLTLAFSKTLLVLPAVLLYYMGAGAIRQELIFWGRILFGAYGESAGFDEYMKMWAFSVKSLGRPRLTPGHRRVEWKCVSVAGIPDLEHPSLTM